ncbi:hypothetical protein QUF64_01435 [Anaerolineales bacterium HSG6]|nr:hypothetical protein [Anaerolineales bacterium HSG6]MDM8532876.1 hypothetical protein [Anaerolineales bacterium HSG25]
MEQAFSTAFAEETITPDDLHEHTQALAILYGELRATHLEAHLQIKPYLTEQQVTHYDMLRGYADGGTGAGHEHTGIDCKLAQNPKGCVFQFRGAFAMSH